MVAAREIVSYSSSLNTNRQPFVRLESHLSSHTLINDLQNTDLVVYHPTDGLGESQRLVARLLSNNLSLIVTALEGFQEYGDAVRCVPPEITPSELAGIMAEELKSRDRRQLAIRQYLTTHGPEEFFNQLANALTNPPGDCRPVPPRPVTRAHSAESR
jgi:hypothetical protein